MTGDAADMAARLRAALPARWFGDVAPVLDAVLAGIGAIWAALHGQIEAAIRQTRIATASGPFLDMIALDFFGRRLRRRTAEADAALRGRILREMARSHGTRGALVGALTDLTGRAPDVFEPARPADTGAYNIAAAYNAAGRWGSLMLPRQCFLTAYRPDGQGIALANGWNRPAGGYNTAAQCWADPAAIGGTVTDADIAATVAAGTPAAQITWLRIVS